MLPGIGLRNLGVEGVCGGTGLEERASLVLGLTVWVWIPTGQAPSCISLGREVLGLGMALKQQH